MYTLTNSLGYYKVDGGCLGQPGPSTVASPLILYPPPPSPIACKCNPTMNLHFRYLEIERSKTKCKTSLGLISVALSNPVFVPP